MHYKRNEPFRYVFSSPIQSTCEIRQHSDTEELVTYTLNASIMDLSPNGMKVSFDTDVIKENSSLLFSFELADIQLQMPGRIVYKRLTPPQSCECGIESDGSATQKEQVIDALKAYTKKHTGK